MEKLLISIDTEFEKGSDESMESVKKLNEELIDLELENTRFAEFENVDKKSKGSGIDWNTIILTILTGSPVVLRLITVLQKWIEGKNGRHIVINYKNEKIDLKNYSAEDAVKIINSKKGD